MLDINWIKANPDEAQRIVGNRELRLQLVEEAQHLRPDLGQPLGNFAAAVAHGAAAEVRLELREVEPPPGT